MNLDLSIVDHDSRWFDCSQTVFVVDQSGSMGEGMGARSRLECAKDAYGRLVNVKFRKYPQDMVAVVSFSEAAISRYMVDLRLGQFRELAWLIRVVDFESAEGMSCAGTWASCRARVAGKAMWPSIRAPTMDECAAGGAGTWSIWGRARVSGDGAHEVRQRLRRVPPQFSWIVHRLVRHHRDFTLGWSLSACTMSAMGSRWSCGFGRIRIPENGKA